MKKIITIQEETVIEQDDKKIILEKGDKISILNEKTWSIEKKIFADLPFEPGETLDSGIYDSLALGTHSSAVLIKGGLELSFFNTFEKETLVLSLSPEEVRNLKKLI